MAYKERSMWEILDVLERVHRGDGRRKTAKATGRSRETVGRYVRKAVSLGWDPKGVHAPTERLAAAVGAALRPGRRAGTSKLDAQLQPHAAQIEKWLSPDATHKRGLTLTKVHELLHRRGVLVSYPGLRRFAQKHLEYGRGCETVRVADVAPGELAEVDFGKLGPVHDPVSDRKRVLWALVVTLVFSRHQFVYVTFEQDNAHLIEGLEGAWDFFGGVPHRVVIDNLKAGVVKADRYEPQFQRTFNEYAKYRDFIIDPAVVRHATGKPHVERQVPYVRENFFRGEQWLNKEHVQREAIRWCVTKAGRRVHGTTRKRPLEEFESLERNALKPLKHGRFDVPSWAEVKVHNDQHVRFGNALYSVPWQHDGRATRGRQVTVRGDSALVRVYLQGVVIKTHPRQEPGGKSTDYADYPQEKADYAMRDPAALISRAKQRGACIGELTERLLCGHFPWTHIRQAKKLLRLADKYGAERVNDACRRALSFDLIKVARVERIVVQAIEKTTLSGAAQPPQAEVIELPLRFLRAPHSFNHKPRTEK